MSIGAIVLENLIHNEQFTRKVIPFLKEEYFESTEEQIAFKLINGFIQKYSVLPSKEEVYLELEKQNLNQKIFDDTKNLIDVFKKHPYELKWLFDNTEKFCQEREIYLALREAIVIADGNDKTRQPGMIPEILRKALSVSFDTSVGHDYLENFELRYELYHKPENKVKFGLKWFNKITKGGVSNKTLNVVLAGLGVGKSLFMAACAADNLMQGYNVLYITLEMAEAGDPSISERIDANLMDISIDDLLIMPRDAYLKKAEKVRAKAKGKLIIKEYPAHGCSAATIRSLLNELKIKKKFEPDIIYVDYLNLCSSATLKLGSNVNTNSYIRHVAEELRAIGQEYDIPLFSATQTNREGIDNSDLSVTNTGESIGLPQTVDFFFALAQTEDLHALNQILVKQLKNRYTDWTKNNKFMIGVDKSKMRLYDVEQSAQADIAGDKPVMDNSEFHERVEDETKQTKKKRLNKKAFEGFT